jgi:hypothetical protein
MKANGSFGSTPVIGEGRWYYNSNILPPTSHPKIRKPRGPSPAAVALKVNQQNHHHDHKH